MVVLDINVLDIKGKEVPDADSVLSVDVSSNVEILGWGNGDPGFKVVERPVKGSRGTFPIQTFSGKAQLILRSIEGADGTAVVNFNGLNSDAVRISYQ